MSDIQTTLGYVAACLVLLGFVWTTHRASLIRVASILLFDCVSTNGAYYAFHYPAAIQTFAPLDLLCGVAVLRGSSRVEEWRWLVVLGYLCRLILDFKFKFAFGEWTQESYLLAINLVFIAQVVVAALTGGRYVVRHSGDRLPRGFRHRDRPSHAFRAKG